MPDLKPFDFLQTTKDGKKCWRQVTERKEPRNESFVYPMNDLRFHAVRNHDCDCKPQLIDEATYTMIVHNSFDYREHTEGVENFVLGED